MFMIRVWKIVRLAMFLKILDNHGFVKTSQGDNAVKSPICKVSETGNPPPSGGTGQSVAKI